MHSRKGPSLRRIGADAMCWQIAEAADAGNVLSENGCCSSAGHSDQAANLCPANQLFLGRDLHQELDAAGSPSSLAASLLQRSMAMQSPSDGADIPIFRPPPTLE
jgi:hypothetical protein